MSEDIFTRCIVDSGCQLKTFKTFKFTVKPLKPLFFSEKTFKNLYFT